ncbi:DUF1629 domain-containing protein [Limibacter armeniacum]|uniref:imm11 family protein n=1 Tax=Limibacter armeniacum TaxID=466084 RepID=UPI002FE4FD05
MYYYRLQALNSVYGILEVDTYKLIDAYHDDIFDELRTSINPIGKYWPKCHGVFYDMTTTDSQVMSDTPDIFIWNNTSLVLSPRALKLLENILESFGELLPFDHNGEQFHLFVVHAIAEADFSKSEKMYDEFGEIGVKHLDFYPESVGSKSIFKSNFDHYRHLYCTQEFRDICIQNNLKGMNFTDKLNSRIGETM